MSFAGLLSSGWFGIPLIPHYFTDKDIDPLNIILTVLSVLSIIWGIMAYREFTKFINAIIGARDVCKTIDPKIGNYDYSSFNPVTKGFERGYVHLSVTDFWDSETRVPDWLDKGKYWHILLRLQTSGKDILLRVDKDLDLQFFSEKKIAATTYKENLTKKKLFRKKSRYIVSIPQWLVMNTDINHITKTRLNISDLDFGMLINSVNKQINQASNTIIEHETKRIKYSWIPSLISIYLVQSLPLKILYEEIYAKTVKYIPAQQGHIIDKTNLNLSYMTIDELSESLLVLAKIRNIKKEKIDKIRHIIRFLRNMYAKQGLGDGSNRYHNFHHSLEVAYLSIQMLPTEFRGTYFTPEDYEFLLIAGLLHDYDLEQGKYKTSIGTFRSEGPKVERTISAISDMRIVDAYYSMNELEFKSYFRENKSSLIPPIDYVTTHPEYVKKDHPIQNIIIQAMIWRTDYPFIQKISSMQKYRDLLLNIKNPDDRNKYELLSEVLWLADLSVTYMSSDPISAWDRVTHLYNELMLSKLEAVSKTDKFFLEFIDVNLFKELINNRNFPNIFRQRWNLIYQFYHEGNPSTQINKTISKAQKSFSKINLDMGLTIGDHLFYLASNHPEEYFVAIGSDERQILNIKNKITLLESQNVTVFWGDYIKLLSNISPRSIDNIFLILSNFDHLQNIAFDKNKFKIIFENASSALKPNGSILLITNIVDNDKRIEIVSMAEKNGFRLSSSPAYGTYFSKSFTLEHFSVDDNLSFLLFQSKSNVPD